MITDNDNDFVLEEFLNSEMENSRMTPPAGVWNRISKEVHPAYRWSLYILTTLLLFIPYSLIMYYTPSKNGGARAGTNTENITNKEQSGTHTIASVNANFNRHNKTTSSTTDVSLNANDIAALDNNTDNTSLVNSINEVDEIASAHNELAALQTADKTPITLPEFSDNIPQKTIASVIKTKANVVNKSNAVVATNNKKTSSRFAWEVYATPSISYRNLTDDKTRLQYYRDIYRNNPFTTDIAAKNVNTVVNQKPLMGKEIGVGTIYSINSRWKLRMGLQFDVRQYATEAYQTNGTANIAYVKNNLLDSISQQSSYATTGINSVSLKNTTYQISMPIGVQWQALKVKKFSMGIGASIQSTYLLRDDTYVLSTDYKNYTKGSNFSRQWNINTAVDVSFNYTNKNITWYAAPQYRYQNLNTYEDIYPIKEHRWDLGLKVGMIKSF